MRIIYFLLIGLFALFITDSHAKMPIKENAKLSYNVYAGGLHALKATLGMSLTEKKYDIKLDAKTNGFIGKLFPWAGHFETIGKSSSNGLEPVNYQSSSTWKKNVNKTELKYSNGDFDEKLVKKHGKTETITNEHFKDNFTIDTVDMLTGVVKLLQKTDINDKCEGSVPIFDGRRRFNLVFKDAGTSKIRKSKYSVFSGVAIKCVVEVEPVLGFRKKSKQRGWMAIQNHTKERDKLPTIWLSRLSEDGPVVPVRMEIASTYGTVIAHLTKAE